MNNLRFFLAYSSNFQSLLLIKSFLSEKITENNWKIQLFARCFCTRKDTAVDLVCMKEIFMIIFNYYRRWKYRYKIKKNAEIVSPCFLWKERSEKVSRDFELKNDEHRHWNTYQQRPQSKDEGTAGNNHL